MSVLKSHGYYDAKTTYFGFVETLNPNANYNESQVNVKVIILHKIKNKLVPIFDDYEYYNLIQSQPVVSYLNQKEKLLFGYLTEAQLQKAISRTGYKEANHLNQNKILKKVA